ncbi:hypothetical protein ABZZ79_29365 [Streptomyces sp. NPDC006458]|uniref:effector-associated domain 2-containing protein n=1 Tax=Streptomyces sp. NPDC006458 TaxID=3154302 RepID=UPI0033A20229
MWANEVFGAALLLTNAAPFGARHDTEPTRGASFAPPRWGDTAGREGVLTCEVVLPSGAEADSWRPGGTLRMAGTLQVVRGHTRHRFRGVPQEPLVIDLVGAPVFCDDILVGLTTSVDRSGYLVTPIDRLARDSDFTTAVREHLPSPIPLVPLFGAASPASDRASAPVAAGKVNPARVHALIVGIESYEAGPSWDLPGPAQQALRFYDTLRRAGVPEGQLRLHLASLNPVPPDIAHSPADAATIRRVLVNDLSKAEGDVLWVWWAGHGIIDRQERLRLLCADATATDMRCVDLESMRARFAGDTVRELSEQLWIVTAGASRESDQRLSEPLPPDTMSAGPPVPSRRQAVIRAAAPGPGGERFSDLLLDLLAERAAVLPAVPDPGELFADARSRWMPIGTGGNPSPDGSMLTITGPDPTSSSPEPGVRVPPVADLARAADALLAYPLATDRRTRQDLVDLMSPRISASLPRSPVGRVDVLGILRTVTRLGPEALRELFEAVVVLDDDPQRGRALNEALRELGMPRV